MKHMFKVLCVAKIQFGQIETNLIRLPSVFLVWYERALKPQKASPLIADQTVA